MSNTGKGKSVQVILFCLTPSTGSCTCKDPQVWSAGCKIIISTSIHTGRCSNCIQKSSGSIYKLKVSCKVIVPETIQITIISNRSYSAWSSNRADKCLGIEIHFPDIGSCIGTIEIGSIISKISKTAYAGNGKCFYKVTLQVEFYDLISSPLSSIKISSIGFGTGYSSKTGWSIYIICKLQIPHFITTVGSFARSIACSRFCIDTG